MDSFPSPHHYRNKMEYSFSCIQYDLEKEWVIDDAFALGFKERTWWMVENQIMIVVCLIKSLKTSKS